MLTADSNLARHLQRLLLTVKSKNAPAALLIFGSGFSALLYQTTWLREFRLIFGSSTAASAAVLAIFMGGLGVGSALMGNRAEKTSNPLRFYATLEFFIALGAALTPLLIWLIRSAYVASGGTFAMGTGTGTLVRLLLAAIVLSVPTLLMGGTLPAMARFAVGEDDGNRRGLALLYGMNTLGAVAGTIAGTFWLFERLGNQTTLYLACTLNVVVAGLAWRLSRGETTPTSSPFDSHGSIVHPSATAPLSLILTASSVTGFVFLLMELVWYRMLSPIFGGTAFTFGLILAVALLGIGIGGIVYSFVAAKYSPTLNGFAGTCALEALFVTIPFALGDRLVVVAMSLQPLSNIGFYGNVFGWLLLSCVIVLPVAIIAGIQFPLLLGLLGSGREKIGTQTGAAYAWNTVGAIAGSLAGGFGFIPLLTATGTWKLVAFLLVGSSVGTMIADQLRTGKLTRAIPSTATATMVIVIWTFATGPTAAWRHSQISSIKSEKHTPNEIRDLFQSLRRDILWQADGIETSIGISKNQSLAFIVNGKSDGNAKRDAGTQIMSGLLAALVHPNPKTAAVVGLGSGSTAGWIAALPSVERVDVVELEPVLTKFAQQCAPVNHDALNNPKLNLIIGDGRELLLTSSQKYDLIVSEPSNPYRAGIASLFTKEYYQAIARKLNNGGLFAQWMQAYDMDLRTIQIFYATIGSVFPHIETWQTQSGDLLLVVSKEQIRYDFDAIRNRIALEPFQSALTKVWRTNDLEGIFSHYVGNDRFAHEVMQQPETPLNTDDRMLLEFAFARNRQTGHHLSFEQMRRDAHRVNADKPNATGELDWQKIEVQRQEMFLAYDHPPQPHGSMSEEQMILVRALNDYASGNLAGALTNWRSLNREPLNSIELTMVSECMADLGDQTAVRYIERLKEFDATEADAIRSRLLWRQGNQEEARTTMKNVLVALHTNPWPMQALISRTVDLAVEMTDGAGQSEVSLAFYDSLQKPFAVYNSDEARMFALIRMSLNLDRGPKGAHVLATIATTEPHTPWNWGFLKIRADCYAAAQHPLAQKAQNELIDFLTADPGGLKKSKLAKSQR